MLPYEDGKHRVYIITSDLVDGVYVGKSNNCLRRWYGHRSRMKWSTEPYYEAMREHGHEAFKMTVIAIHDTKTECLSSEAGAMLAVIASGGKLWNSMVPKGPIKDALDERARHHAKKQEKAQ